MGASINGNRMKIGIDCRKIYDPQLNEGAGIERYTYHLVRTLLKQEDGNEYVIFCYNDLSPETIHKLRRNNTRVKIVKLMRLGSRIPIYESHWKISRVMIRENLDLAIFPANHIPLFYRKRSFVIVHDMAIYLHPEWFPDKQWFATKVLLPKSFERAEKIITVSRNTKLDLLKLFKLPESKIEVIYPGIVAKDKYLPEELNKVKKKFDISGEYLLFLGTIEPRKNIVRLANAFASYLFDANREVKLILAGAKGWKYQPIFEEIAEINKKLPAPAIKYIGKVTNRERNLLIKSARGFVYPSVYEGFGFPVLEAMSLGVPVLTSKNSSLEEICGDAALLAESGDIPDLKRNIRILCEDETKRLELIEKGKAKSDEFRWSNTVAKIKSLF
jgi:glycosyltransferase involved in cell wall biosynthesis